MSLTLSVTSSTTLFVTNIAAGAATLTFASSLDGATYTTIPSVPASPIAIPVGTTAYSLTNQLIPSYYYRVTTGSGSSATTQYILQTKSAGSSTSSFSNNGTGSATIGSTSVTMNGAGNSVQSDQTYPSSQGLYYQLNTPTGTAMGNAVYTMTLFSSADISAFFRVTTSGSTTTAGIFRRDSGAETQIGSNTTLSANPTNIAFYWDGVDTISYYIGGALIASYKFTAAWTTVRASVQMTSITTPFTLSDVRIYPTGRIPTATNWRLNISNVTNTSLSPTSATYGTYYYITNTGFNTLTLPSTFVADPGAFWVLRNNTSVYLSVSVANPGTAPSVLPSPLVIPPSNSATIIVTATGYVLF
jgi:hypothetical protein